MLRRRLSAKRRSARRNGGAECRTGRASSFWPASTEAERAASAAPSSAVLPVLTALRIYDNSRDGDPEAGVPSLCGSCCTWRQDAFSAGEPVSNAGLGQADRGGCSPAGSELRAAGSLSGTLPRWLRGVAAMVVEDQPAQRQGRTLRIQSRSGHSLAAAPAPAGLPARAARSLTTESKRLRRGAGRPYPETGAPAPAGRPLLCHAGQPQGRQRRGRSLLLFTPLKTSLPILEVWSWYTRLRYSEPTCASENLQVRARSFGRSS
jgi:hypothetical protein